MAFEYKTALVIGGSRGVGRALSKKLSKMGARVVAVARNKGDLDLLAEASPEIETIAVDASEDGAAKRLIAEISPDLLVLMGGHMPKMGSINGLTWDEFSSTWNSDTKTAFEFVTEAVRAPLRQGAAIVSFASGAALGGSPLSGGYAGAKRMQHFISNYGKFESERHELGLKFYTIYPKQFIVGTTIAEEASAAYAALRQVTPEQFMNQWDKALTPDLASDYVIKLLSDESGANTGAYSITGAAMEALA